MYYKLGKTSHGLKPDLFKSCMVPRPIGWISTLNTLRRQNIAPYSQFQNVTFNPPIVMFSANQSSLGNREDTVLKAEQTGEFVWNMCSCDLREAMNFSAQELAPAVSEIEAAGWWSL